MTETRPTAIAINCTIGEIESLAEKARARIASETACSTYAQLYPAIAPIVEDGGRDGIANAVQFLIEEGIISESQRGAAERGLRRARKQISRG